MKFLIAAIFMSIEAFSQVQQWEHFNSCLLIEVTRPHGVFTCSGVAISDRTVLTAAHCLDGEITKIKVFVQDTYNPRNTFLEVSSFMLHPEYDKGQSRYRSDLAKILMKERLPRFIKIQPVHHGEAISGKLFRFGYGGRNNQNVRTVITPVLRKFDQTNEVLELEDKFSRSGDSGGPVFLQTGQEIQLLAIHSTFSFGPQGEFSLNPLLGPHSDWIFDN